MGSENCTIGGAQCHYKLAGTVDRAATRLILSIIVQAITALFLLLLLTACGRSDTGPDRIEHYITRLARTLDARPPEQQITPVARISAADLMPLPVTRSNIDVLDFLSLSDCALQVNLGRRNSSLGRTASASQRLLLDLEFLDLAPACIAEMRSTDRNSLAEQLSIMADSRRSELPISIYNAIFAGPEFQQFWQMPSTLDDYPERTSSAIADTLTRLDTLAASWLTGDYNTGNMQFEHLLAELRAGDGGALLRAAHIQSAMLAQADAMLVAASLASPLCSPDLKSPKVEIIGNIISRYFVDDVQRWLADVSKRRHLLMPPIESLEMRLNAVLPSNYVLWQTMRSQQIEDLAGASRRHVEAIQYLLRDCSGMAGNTVI